MRLNEAQNFFSELKEKIGVRRDRRARPSRSLPLDHAVGPTPGRSQRPDPLPVGEGGPPRSSRTWTPEV